MEVIQSALSQFILAPVYAAAADLFKGALLMPGVTAETNDGVLINCTATSNAKAVGILDGLLDYSVSGESLVDGTTWFYPKTAGVADIPAKRVALIGPAVLCKVAYDTVDTMAVASSSGTTITITDLEDNIDTGFLYVVSGTGIGQIEIIVTSASGSCTVATAFATAVDSTSTMIKILPLFHDVVRWDIATATDTTKLGTDAAVGSGRATILANYISRNSNVRLLDPDRHGGLTGLNSITDFQIYAVVNVVNTSFAEIA